MMFRGDAHGFPGGGPQAAADRRHRNPARRTLGAAVWILVAPALLLVVSGCYNPKRGNPVDEFHYQHVITITPDFSSASVLTYINRTQLKVGIRREDLYDGNRDGQLTTPGMDRVMITDYVDVEDPPEKAVRRMGEIRDYDAMFRKIIAAAKAGQPSIKLDDRTYELRMLAQNLAPLASGALG